MEATRDGVSLKGNICRCGTCSCGFCRSGPSLCGHDYVRRTIHTNPLYFTINGTHYSGEYGGSFPGSTLNGQSLPFLYCVDVNDYFYPGSTYNATVSRNGTLFGSSTPVQNAGRIVWLLETYATAANSNTIQQAALQLSIWAQEYGPNFIVDSGTGQSIINAYNAIANAGIGTTTDQATWISPYNSDGSHAQAQVTLTPEPASMAMIGIGVSGVAAFSWVRRRRNVV